MRQVDYGLRGQSGLVELILNALFNSVCNVLLCVSRSSSLEVHLTTLKSNV